MLGKKLVAGGATLLIGCLLLTSAALAQDRRVKLRFQGGVNAGVPLFLDVDRSIVKPGASLTGWGGFESVATNP
ncbi:MAG: hypothetical protein WBG86_21685 [Polyangiales bacterium]